MRLSTNTMLELLQHDLPLSARDRLLFEVILLMQIALAIACPLTIASLPFREIDDHKRRTKAALRALGRQRKTVDRHVNLSVEEADRFRCHFSSFEPFDLTQLPHLRGRTIQLLQVAHTRGIFSIEGLRAYLSKPPSKQNPDLAVLP